MLKSKHRLSLVNIVLPVAILAIDQLYKYKIRHFGGFYICNSGIAFNIKITFLFFWLLLAIFSSTILICYLFLKNKLRVSKWFYMGLILIISGAISNILDRAFFGCVFDYIFLFKNFFPIFNLADLAIFIGSVFVIFKLLIPSHIKKCITRE